jgi:NAD(P)-dependent dehydrogenase (short-subunit alcohol dehydrogenase family)
VNLTAGVAVVTGGGSGLGAATARELAKRGMDVAILDLNAESATETARSLRGWAIGVGSDVTDPISVDRALDDAAKLGPIRALVHCAGRGGSVRVLDRQGSPGSMDDFTEIVRVNLIGTFNMVRLASARMAASAAVDGERGVCVLTASVAAFEGQVGQVGYASSKAGIVGMSLVAARDLASKQIRVCSIAPGIFDTPMIARVPEETRARLGASIPHPSRLGLPEEYARLALHIIENPMLNGETIRLDGALRMAPR